MEKGWQDCANWQAFAWAAAIWSWLDCRNCSRWRSPLGACASADLGPQAHFIPRGRRGVVELVVDFVSLEGYVDCSFDAEALVVLLFLSTYCTACNKGRYIGHQSLTPLHTMITVPDPAPDSTTVSPRRHPVANSGPSAVHALAKDTAGGDTTRAKVTCRTASNCEASPSSWPWGRSSSLLRLVRNGYTVAPPVREGSTRALLLGCRSSRDACGSSLGMISSSPHKKRKLPARIS